MTISPDGRSVFAHRGQAPIPYWMSVATGLPIAATMAIMSFPDLFHGHVIDFRVLFLCAFTFWIFPVAALQRRLWVSRLPMTACAGVLLLATYGMSVVNNVLGMVLGVHLKLLNAIVWKEAFSGLDGCWLALIAFCATHAVLMVYTALGNEQRRSADALLAARDAQLRALRYQLHPHFLFNTLNGISTLIISERNRDANRMITELGEFLRATLDAGDRHEHALADELALTENYLNIEKARLGSRLVTSMQLGEDVLDASVPYLLLQPLIENAIRHGIAPLQSGGTIDLSIRRQGDQLAIRVINDCAASVAASAARGVGLNNISQRLHALYGDVAQVAVVTRLDAKFQVDVVLPYQSGQQAVTDWSDAA